ncbi:hypothetical protein K438DRAFT_1784229 [Mycena galopus ATCC 62051]|nr:hypothetical protein K438DRAFT_1784229 [Mycena galopus ATCC 62051]
MATIERCALVLYLPLKSLMLPNASSSHCSSRSSPLLRMHVATVDDTDPSSWTTSDENSWTSWIQDERERAVRNARVCAARAATLSDSTDTAKNLQYKRLAAAYTELYGFFFADEDDGINDTQEIWAYIRQQRGEGCERDNRARVGPADALLDTAA